ncbi:MAG: hypothetical protein ACTSQJ_20030 [Promethearchaeota archaeon]
MREFKVNDYITLKLENEKSIIYVAGEKFNQCKFLFLINPQEKERQEEINSIDEASELLIGELEKRITPEELGLSPEEEFWGHCSNLQVWYEYNYDTRLLHSNLAFPLLKKLTEAGDPIAKRVFKEEIVVRFLNGMPSVQIYLIKEGYLEILQGIEMETLIKNLTPNKCRNFIRNVLDLSNFHEERELFLKKLALRSKLFQKLLSISNGIDLLELLTYAQKKDIRYLLNKETSTFFKNLLQALKIYEFDLDWNPIYYLGPKLFEAGIDMTNNLKRKIIKVLNGSNLEDLLIIIKLRWLKHIALNDFLKNPKINLIKNFLEIICLRLRAKEDYGVIIYELAFLFDLLLDIFKSQKSKIKESIISKLSLHRDKLLYYLKYMISSNEVSDVWNSQEIKETAKNLIQFFYNDNN